jgi:hypothetical protein
MPRAMHVSDQIYYSISAVFQACLSMHRDTPHIFEIWVFSPMLYEAMIARYMSQKKTCEGCY